MPFLSYLIMFLFFVNWDDGCCWLARERKRALKWDANKKKSCTPKARSGGVFFPHGEHLCRWEVFFFVCFYPTNFPQSRRLTADIKAPSVRGISCSIRHILLRFFLIFNVIKNTWFCWRCSGINTISAVEVVFFVLFAVNCINWPQLWVCKVLNIVFHGLLALFSRKLRCISFLCHVVQLFRLNAPFYYLSIGLWSYDCTTFFLIWLMSEKRVSVTGNVAQLLLQTISVFQVAFLTLHILSI